MKMSYSGTDNSKAIRQQMEAERKLTKIYRNSPGYKSPVNLTLMTNSGQIIDLRTRLPTTRSPSLPAPRTVNIQLRDRVTDYNKGGPLIEGQLSRPPVNGPAQWTHAERLAWAMAQSARAIRRGAKFHPVTRALDLMMTAFDLWNLINSGAKYPPEGSWDIPPGWNFRCGSPGGNHMVTRPAVSSGTSPTFCALTFQAKAVQGAMPGPTQGRAYHFQTVYKVGASERADNVCMISYLSPYTGPGPTYRPAEVPLFVPMLTEPLPFNLATSETAPKSSDFRWPVPPKPPAFKWPTPPRPPGPRTKEKKGQAQVAVGKAVAAAFAATEAADAIDAIWDALPGSIKARTAKSGTTRKGAMIGQGVRYSTPWDKFQAVYRNLHRVDMSEAMKNLIINQLVDQVIGQMSSKGADKLRKQLGASGWGNII